jgi:hypothetical protein
MPSTAFPLDRSAAQPDRLSALAALIGAAQAVVSSGTGFHPSPEDVEHRLATLRSYVVAADRLLGDAIDEIESALSCRAFNADHHRDALTDAFDGNVAPPIQIEADRIRQRRDDRERRYDAIYNADVMGAA